MSTPAPSPRHDVLALFAPEGDALVPTVFAVGPWRADAVHGAAVAALFASVLDRPAVTVARLTVDLFAAVPLAPLSLEVEGEEGGRTVRRRSAALRHEGRLVARADAVYVAESPVELPPRRTAGDGPPMALAPLPEGRIGWPNFETRAMAMHTRAASASTMEGWFRLLVPAVAGSPVTGLQSALAAADFSAGSTAMVLSMKRYSFMSVDLTVNLARRPVGDWVGMRAEEAALGDHGVGVAASVLHDEGGVFGRCTQTQVVRALRPAREA